MALYQLIYISELAADESVLAAIHSHAVRNNTARTVTGMLLYANGRFLQILEGERADVTHTFERIEEDPRHRRVRVVLQGAIEARLFSHWNMGFRHLSREQLEQDNALKSYFERDYESAGRDSAEALAVLSQFA